MIARILITILVLNCIFNATVTFAQEASISAGLPPPSPSSLIESAIESLAQAPESGLSIDKKPLPDILPLNQTVFKSTEPISITIENDDPEKILVELFDQDNQKIDTTIEKKTLAENASLTISPPANFKPGKYHLKITDSIKNISEQEFFWGILAINTNKSIYQVHDLAKFQLAILDETGHKSCDAKIKLTITDPQQQKKEYTTDNQTIQTNPACQTQQYEQQPNFQTTYQIADKEGRYTMTLEATMHDHTYRITDDFQVKKAFPFIVERTGDTHITPLVRYTMMLSVIALEDFRGEISEVVPADFAIGPVEQLPPFTVATRAAETPLLKPAAISFDLPFTGFFPRTQGFGVRETDPLMAAKYHRYGLSGHDGVDYAMPFGTPIFSVDDGIVVLTKKYGDYGTTIVVQHRWGTSYYGHLSRITTQQGALIRKGQQIGLSGDTGLSTGPHLHFGIKLKNNDLDNGYFGKTDPLPYLTNNNSLLGQVKGIATDATTLRQDVDPRNEGIQIITWNVNLKQGEKLQLGYTYLSEAKNKQLYTLDPLEFNTSTASDSGSISETVSSKYTHNDELVFKEDRLWQISVDYTDQGSMTVNPDKGMPDKKGQKYSFTYTTGESIDDGSGTVSLQIPKGWSPPQTTSWSLPGRTTIDKSSTGIAADILNSMDRHNWQTNNACSQGLSIDIRDKQEGRGSLTCVHGNEKYGSWSTTIPPADWTNYTKVGMWIKVSSPLKHGQLQFSYDNSEQLSSPLEHVDLPEVATQDVWTWVTGDLDPKVSRTKILSYGFRASNASSLDHTTISIDYLLIGPGTPQVSGDGPWTITVPILSIPANNGTIVINYGGESTIAGVTNPTAEGIHTFVTKATAQTTPTRTLSTLAKQPTITLSQGAQTPNNSITNGLWIPRDERKPFSF